MARENRLWEWMHDHGKLVDDLDMQRVENLLIQGMPDVDLNWRGSEAWVELKGTDRPAKASTPIRLARFTDLQRLWLQRRWRVGGLSWLYVRVGQGHRISRYILCPGVPGLLERAQRGMVEAEYAEASDLPPNHTFAQALSRFCHRLDYPR